VTRNAIRQDIVQFALPALVIFSAGLAVSAWDLIEHQERLTEPSLFVLMGLALVIAGLLLRILAAVTLRRSYSSTLIVRDGHQLVTYGIYRTTRHPIYLGVIVSTVGMPIAVSSLYGLLIMLALIPLLMHRIRIEERMLMSEYGDAYCAYQRATRKLIPFVY